MYPDFERSDPECFPEFILIYIADVYNTISFKRVFYQSASNERRLFAYGKPVLLNLQLGTVCVILNKNTNLEH